MNEQAILAALARNPALLAALAGGVQAATKEAATSPTVIAPNGPDGLLSVYGLEPNIFNAMAMPLAGLEARLPVRRSNFTNPKFGILTGQTAASGDEPTAACATPRRPGNLKLCWQTWDFGRLTMETNVIRLDNAGQRIDRSEFMDYRLVGNPWADTPSAAPATLTPQQALRNKYAKAMAELWTDMEREYRPLLFTGNPANTAGSAGYIEFYGLDGLVRTGYRDGGTGVLCPAADSYVNTALASQNVQANGALVVRQIVEGYRVRIKYLAEQLRLSVTGAFVMRFGLFRALTEIWPCVYETFRCTTAAPGDNATVFVDGREQERMRAEMRAGMYLLIDDERVPVIIDDSIPEAIPVGGQGQSDLYFVPLTVNGEPATYLDYFDFRGPEGAQTILNEMGPLGQSSYAISPDGRFLFHFLPPTYWCLQVAVVTYKRLILRAPFLAAKWTDMRYTFTVHEREYDPNDPYYFVNGGQYQQDTPPYLYPPFSN